MKHHELIEQKLANMLAYIDANCPPPLVDKFKVHRGIKAEAFMLEYIAPFIYPSRDKLDDPIDYLLGISGINRKTIPEVHIEKIKAYLAFFCDMLQ